MFIALLNADINDFLSRTKVKYVVAMLLLIISINVKRFRNMNKTFNIQLCSVTSMIAKIQNGNNFRDFRSHREKKNVFSSFGVKRYDRPPGSA